MRIALIGQKGIPASWGGVERHVEDLSTGMVQHGHSVTAYCRKWYTSLSPQGAKAYARKNYKGVRLVFLPSLRTKHLDTITHVFFASIHALFQNYEVIHYHGVGPALMAWIPRLFAPRAKVIITFHSPDRLHGKWGDIARAALTWGEWASCRFAHETITVSYTLQQYIADTYKTPTIYVPNGVYLPKKIAPEIAERVMRAHHLKPNRYFVVVARLISHKGIHFAIEAWRRLERDYPSVARGFSLVIVGDAQGDAAYARTIERMAKKAPRTIMAGWQTGDELNALIANSYASVHPSQSEGLSIAMLEAMSHAKPIIASDLPEHLELVSDRRFWYEKNKASELEDKLAWLIQNPEIAKVNGLLNYERVAREFNFTHIVPHIERIYKETVLHREWTLASERANAEQ